MNIAGFRRSVRLFFPCNHHRLVDEGGERDHQVRLGQACKEAMKFLGPVDFRLFTPGRIVVEQQNVPRLQVPEHSGGQVVDIPVAPVKDPATEGESLQPQSCEGRLEPGTGDADRRTEKQRPDS